MTTKTPRRRLVILVLSVIGIADALYMLSYTLGWTKKLWCPFFGDGCDIVGRSAHAWHFGVPNSAAGAAGYAAMAALAAPRRESAPPVEPDWRPFALALLATGAAGASAYLTWEMYAKVRAWCFWCLLSAALNAVIFPLALGDLTIDD